VGLNAGNARLAFDMLSGELHGSIRTAQSEAAQGLAATLTGRMDAARSIETGAAFWAQATGSRTRMATDGNAASLTHGATGLMIGADAGFGAVRLGVAGGASQHDYDSHARAGSAEGTSLSLAAYGSGQWGALGLKGAVSGTWHEVETERRVMFPGFAERLTADYDAETVHAFVEASWRVAMGPGATLEPFVNIARVRTDSDGFTETGGDAALAVQGRVQAASLATIGLGMSRSYDQGDGRTAVLSGRLGWRHAWDDTAGDGRHAFAASPTPAGVFTVHGLPITEDALITQLGLDLDLKDRLSLTVDWSAQLASHLNANTLAATLNWRF
ncbi:MAG: autotransporter outer membrane beta-barrel domain-containing protein, partial [Brevundimonas sp.]